MAAEGTRHLHGRGGRPAIELGASAAVELRALDRRQHGPGRIRRPAMSARERREGGAGADPPWPWRELAVAVAV